MLSICVTPPLKCQHYFEPGPSSSGVKRIRSAYAMSSSGVKRAYAEASPLPNFFSPLPSCNPDSGSFSKKRRLLLSLPGQSAKETRCFARAGSLNPAWHYPSTSNLLPSDLSSIAGLCHRCFGHLPVKIIWGTCLVRSHKASSHW